MEEKITLEKANYRAAKGTCDNCTHNSAEGWEGNAYCTIFEKSTDEYMACDYYKE